MIRKILTRLPTGKRFNRSTIRHGEAVHSCLRWTPSFHEKYRTCHILTQWNRRHEADEPGGARLGTRNRKTDKTGEHFLVRSEEHTSELQSPYDLVCR